MNIRGQNISEYGLVVIVLIVAFTAMNTYFKRGVQGVIKTTSDNLGACAAEDYKLLTGQSADYQTLGIAEPGMISGSISPETVTQGITMATSDNNGQVTRHVEASFSTGVVMEGIYSDRNLNAGSKSGAVSSPGSPKTSQLGTGSGSQGGSR